jgi:hypothetical protein
MPRVRAISFRGAKADHEQREAGGGHPERGAGEVKKDSENRWRHRTPEPAQSTSFYVEPGLNAAGRELRSIQCLQSEKPVDFRVKPHE